MPDPLGDLLEVQAHDTAIDQLEHRRRSLPERAELSALEGRIAEAETSIAEATARRDAAAAEQVRLEGEVGDLDDRITQIDKRLYGGPVTAARDLEAMAGEVVSLKRRRSQLEDDALAAMDAVESLDVALADRVAHRSRLDAEAGDLRARIAEAEVMLDAEAQTHIEPRAALASTLPADLLQRYEGLRTKHGGVGAARLEHGSCTGCHLKLPSSELERIKRLPPGEMITCDQCGRILVS